MGIILNQVLLIKEHIKMKVNWLTHFYKAGKWWRWDSLQFLNRVSMSLSIIQHLKRGYYDSFCIVEYHFLAATTILSILFLFFVNLDLHMLGQKQLIEVFFCALFDFFLNRRVSIYISAGLPLSSLHVPVLAARDLQVKRKSHGLLVF